MNVFYRQMRGPPIRSECNLYSDDFSPVLPIVNFNVPIASFLIKTFHPAGVALVINDMLPGSCG